MNVGNNLTIESRQDSNQYDSKQTQVNAGASVTFNGSGSASFNASRNKAKLNYAQVEEQSGLSAGEGGLEINVGNHILHLGVVLAVCFSLIDDTSLGEFIELFEELFIDGIKFLPFSFIVIIVSFLLVNMKTI